ncbi:MAG: RNA polymerase sigma factor [Dehalogenimonas sp.]|uniref:RNA polymerase sigma factor n=1 Tax=Candidatus Dehalogenimonas loeffleri TaxID=3127115 RepID=A0ABZ2J947_9CHLR|nr:RNA polymerase sigma factor [Dehalogenimonas sp.]
MANLKSEAHTSIADIDSAVKGDTAAFGRLFDMYVDDIYKHVYYRVGSAQDAQDISQQVFINAFKAISRFRNTNTPFLGWLMRIAHNLIVDYYRSKKPQSNLDPELDIRDEAEDPTKISERHAIQSLLQKTILKLPEAQQQVILFHFIEGFDYPLIAKMIGKSEGAVRVLQHRGLSSLRRLLGSKETILWET